MSTVSLQRLIESQGTTVNDDDVCCGGTIQKERRRFILLLSFDLILCSLLWFILTVSASKGHSDLPYAFWRQIVFPTVGRFFSFSLFDIVILSLFRFAFLLLLYALVRLEHWWPVLVTVLVSCAFLLFKVFYYEFSTSQFNGNVLQYVLIITSFSLAWFELWLMDVRVLPRERRRKRRAILAAQLLAESLDNSTAQTATTNGTAPQPSRSRHAYSDVESDRAAFFSVAEYSSESSDDESAGLVGRFWSLTGMKKKPIPFRDWTLPEYEQFAAETLSDATALYNEASQWPRMATPKALHVAAQQRKPYGRVFFVKESFDCSAEVLFNAIYNGFELSPTWNKTLKACKVLLRVSDSTDVSYYVTTPTGNGLISPRDFVDVRHMVVPSSSDPRYLIATRSIQTSLKQVQRELTRGENGPNLIVIEPVTQSTCLFTWLMNTNIKGKLPRSVVQKSLSRCLVDYVRALHMHLGDKAAPPVEEADLGVDGDDED